jgi:hypothetical protein
MPTEGLEASELFVVSEEFQSLLRSSSDKKPFNCTTFSTSLVKNFTNLMTLEERKSRRQTHSTRVVVDDDKRKNGKNTPDKIKRKAREGKA